MASFPILHTLDSEHRSVLLQAGRYAVAGLVITLLFSAAYWVLARYFHVDANLSLFAVWVVFTGISYVTHGAFSFKGHGERDRHHVRAMRFMVVNLIGLAVNQGFVWLLVKQLHGAEWWPTIPFVFVTPWLTFALNRRWVYG